MYAKPNVADRNPGRHSYPGRRRPAGAADVRKSCLRVLMLLVVQFILGIFLDLYVTIPASDHDTGFAHELGSAPLSLTLHALIGLALIAAAIAAVVRAVAAGSKELTLLTAGGLASVFGAFAAGEIFVRSGSTSSSMTMALLAGVALLCYIAAFSVASLPDRDGAARHASAADGAGDEFASYESGSAVQYGIIEEFDPVDDYETDGYEPDGYAPDDYERAGYQPVDYEPARYQPVDYEPSRPMPPVSAGSPPELPRRQPHGQPMPGQPQWSEPSLAPARGQSARHGSDQRQPDRRDSDQRQSDQRQPRRRQSDRRQSDESQSARRRSDRHLPEHWQPEQWQPEQRQPEQWSPEQWAPQQRQPEQRQPEQWQPDQWAPEQRQPEQRAHEQWQPEQRRPEWWEPKEDRPVPEPRYNAEPNDWPATSQYRTFGPYRDE